jgi:aminoglycoside 6'-N-acetyltransferase I
MHIVDLRSDDEGTIRQIAALLVESFAINWPEAWPDMEAAIEEVQQSFGAERISRVALDEDDTVLGWVSQISSWQNQLCVKPGEAMMGNSICSRCIY